MIYLQHRPGAIGAQLTQLFVLSFSLSCCLINGYLAKLGMSECGYPDVTLNLCLWILSSYPLSASGSMRR